PGPVMEANMVSERANNYIAGRSHFQDGTYVIADNDLTKGENSVPLVENGWDGVIHESLTKLIDEIVISSNLPEELQTQLRDRLNVTLSYQDEIKFDAEFRNLCDNLNDERLMKAFSRLLNYIKHTQKRSLDHLQAAQIIQLDEYLTLDMYSKRNL